MGVAEPAQQRGPLEPHHLVQLGRGHGAGGVPQPAHRRGAAHRLVECALELDVEGVPRPDLAHDAELRDDVGEALLVSVDVLAESRVARDAQRHMAGFAGVHDGARPSVAHDDGRVGQQVGEAVVAEEVVRLGHQGRAGRAVLDHEVDVAVPGGGGVDPVDHPGEGVVVGAHQRHDESGHRSGPTRWASG